MKRFHLLIDEELYERAIVFFSERGEMTNLMRTMLELVVSLLENNEPVEKEKIAATLIKDRERRGLL